MIEKKKPKTSTLDAFAMAAGNDRGPILPWEDPRVRDDVKQTILLRLPERLYLKLKYISENSKHSMTSFITNLIEEPINKMANDLASTAKAKERAGLS